jgi:hypothetical protein
MKVPSRYQPVFDFLGYGAKGARFVFLGEKEYTPGGTEHDNVDIRLASFATPGEDKDGGLDKLSVGFARLGQSAIARDFAAAKQPESPFAWGKGRPGSVTTWTWCAMVRRAFRDAGTCVDGGAWFSDWMSDYQRLGCLEEPDTFLAELFPLPMRNVTTWPAAYSVFGCSTADEFFQQCWPIGAASPRRAAVRTGVIDTTPDDGVVVAYGRGGKGAEFWRRYDELLAPRVSSFRGSKRRWHELVPKVVEVALDERGRALARVGFPYNRPNANPVTERHVPQLVNALRELRRDNSCPPI